MQNLFTCVEPSDQICSHNASMNHTGRFGGVKLRGCTLCTNSSPHKQMDLITIRHGLLLFHVMLLLDTRLALDDDLTACNAIIGLRRFTLKFHDRIVNLLNVLQLLLVVKDIVMFTQTLIHNLLVSVLRLK